MSVQSPDFVSVSPSLESSITDFPRTNQGVVSNLFQDVSYISVAFALLMACIMYDQGKEKSHVHFDCIS